MKRLIALSLLTLFLVFTPAVLAQTPTRVRTATSSTTTNNIKEKIATKVAEIKSNFKYASGKITSVKDTTIQIQTTSGKVISVATTSTTKFIDQTSSKTTATTIKNLKVADSVAVVGLTPEDSIGTARLVAKISPPKARITVVGTITNVKIASGSSSLKTKTATQSATLSLLLKTGATATVQTNANTKIHIPNSPNLLSPTDLEVGQVVVSVGMRDTNPYIATQLVVIAQNPRITPTPTKIGTTAATPTSTR